VNELLNETGKKSKKCIMFLDPHKGQVKLWRMMFDLSSRGPLPIHTQKPCWSCRNRFQTHPIGCPIEYHPHLSSGKKKEKREELFRQHNLNTSLGNDYFDTEGIFCTFSCVKNYILHQIRVSRLPKYRKALTYLSTLHLRLTGKLSVIPRGKSWRLGIEWGGHMTARQQRASVGLLDYIETINVERPYMFCTGQLIQEHRVKV
jgi:hypothetical protein